MALPLPGSRSWENSLASLKCISSFANVDWNLLSRVMWNWNLSFPVKVLKAALDSVCEARMHEVAGTSLWEGKLLTGFPIGIPIIVYSILFKGNLAEKWTVAFVNCDFINVAYLNATLLFGNYYSLCNETSTFWGPIDASNCSSEFNLSSLAKDIVTWPHHSEGFILFRCDVRRAVLL